MAKIVLASNGSLGDIYPFLGLGICLKKKGHVVVFASMEHYKPLIESHDLIFKPIRPEIPIFDPVLYKKVMDPVKGTEFVYKEVIMKQVELSYQDLYSACEGADFLVGHCIAVACPVVGEVKKLPWISVGLAPASYWSVYDVSIFDPIWWLNPTRTWGPKWWNIWKTIASTLVKSWSSPLYDLRKKLGLAAGKNPVMQAWHSETGEIAFFSKYFAKPQPDWPKNVCQAGFPLFDAAEYESLKPETERFISSFPNPLVVTLGSAATYFAENFYEQTALASMKLNQPTVLIIGKNNQIKLPKNLPEFIHVSDYEPYSTILSKASGIIHQGGIGTTSQALAAGKPMMIVPFSHDQPDNAARVERLGCGISLAKNKLTVDSVIKKIQRLQSDKQLQQNCKLMNENLKKENGIEEAAKYIESLLTNK